MSAQAVRTVRHEAGSAAETARRTVGTAVGDVRREAGRLGETVEREVATARTNVRREAGHVGAAGSDEWKRRVNEPIDATWYRVFKRGHDERTHRWVTTWEHYVNKGHEASDRLATRAGDGVSHIPDIGYADEVEHRRLPNGQARMVKDDQGIQDEVLHVEAPQGGEVGYDIGEDMEGKKVRITYYVDVEEGRARAGLGRSDGEILGSADDWVGEGTLRKVSFMTAIPIVERDYGGVDGAFDYRALLELEPGSKVNVRGVVVERVKDE